MKHLAVRQTLTLLLTLLLGAQSGREGKRQTIAVHIVRVHCRRGAGQNLQRVFLQDGAHLPLHTLGPGQQVGLRAPGSLHQPLLSVDEARQLLQVVMELLQDWVGGSGASRGPLTLGAVEPRRGLAGHVAFELLGGQVERLSIQLLNEGHSAALKAEGRESGVDWTLMLTVELI